MGNIRSDEIPFNAHVYYKLYHIITLVVSAWLMINIMSNDLRSGGLYSCFAS